MIILLSPSKTLDFEHNIMGETEPSFIEDTITLNKSLKKYSKKKLGELMKISDKLAALNYQRNQAFQEKFTEENSRAAMFAFKGDVYVGLQAQDFKKKDVTYANKHLRILSGLYGLLRPMDKMQAYRLEMGTSLKVGKKKNLYEFWGNKIADQLKESLADHKNKSIINLASNEYFKAAQPKTLPNRVIVAKFMEDKDGKSRPVQYYTKFGRGLMARWIMQNRVDRADGLKDFNAGGYKFDPARSTDELLVFARPQPPKKGK